jgi:Zn-dependent alcohol dehydrogenase
MGARMSGAIPIIAIDTLDVKLEAAKKFGATHGFNPLKCNVVEEVKKITAGLGVDHSMVAVAGKTIKKTAFDVCSQFGQMVIVGHELYENEWLKDINAMDLLFGKRITGSVMGAIKLRKDVPIYEDYYRHGMVDIDSLLTHRFTLDNLREALEDSMSGALKNVVVIGGQGLGAGEPLK